MGKSINCGSILVAAMLLMPLFSTAGELIESGPPVSLTDERPPLVWAVHGIGAVGMGVLNEGIWGDPWSDHPSVEWPTGSECNYLWVGDLWSSCYGAVTPEDSIDKWTSCSDYGNWDLSPSEGCPMEYLTPGTVAPEQSQYGVDDWDLQNNHPYGLQAWVENYSWDTPGFDRFIASELVLTHHSEYGNPGVPLHGLVIAIRGDCDVATSDSTDCHLDDLVSYDGHAIWCNDPDATFEYLSDDGTHASTQDYYTFMQNPDNPLPADDPDNIWYHYNYFGPDGLPDNDVDQNGVSDHFTILAKVADGDTTFIEDQTSGVVLFSEGMPYWHWEQTVGDTTFLVVPRNLSYMWDSDNPNVPGDDSGEPSMPMYCNGFIGWRLLDCWIVKADRSVERPVDVIGCPIPLAHEWWNWEEDPGSEGEKYDFTWGLNPGGSGNCSGPTYLSDWVGDPLAPEALQPQNPGPFPFVRESPILLGYPVFDYRFLISVGPVTLEDGDSLHVVGGWVIGAGLDGLRRNADLLLDAYCRELIWGSGTGIGEAPGPVMPAWISVAPNPMHSSARLRFSMPESGAVEISVYDLSGRVVLRRQAGEFDPGEHSIGLDTTTLDPGVYFIRMDLSGDVLSEKFVIIPN
jgi:hypothetical protein